VALVLFQTHVEEYPYLGRPAYDAVVAKLQQAAEHALKAAVLALAPEAAHLVFYPHRLLSEADLPRSRRFRALMDKLLKVSTPGGLRRTLEELERYAPAGTGEVVLDASGVILALPLNTEYVFLPRDGVSTAPATAWKARDRDAVRYAKAVNGLFRLLKGLPELGAFLEEYRDPPIRLR
jgi:hypothetical protein